jgi:integrase
MRPVDGFGKAKLRLDAAMGVILGRPVEPFVLHDLRRTVRSRLSELRVPPVVAECVIGHALPGLLGVYDKWDYIDEKREALARWSARLSEIVQ